MLVFGLSQANVFNIQGSPEVLECDNPYARYSRLLVRTSEFFQGKAFLYACIEIILKLMQAYIDTFRLLAIMLNEMQAYIETLR